MNGKLDFPQTLTQLFIFVLPFTKWTSAIQATDVEAHEVLFKFCSFYLFPLWKTKNTTHVFGYHTLRMDVEQSKRGYELRLLDKMY